jgi:hypothetical protein
VILEGCAGLPLLAWTVGAAGGSLVGRVTSAGACDTFTAWQLALAMDEVLEIRVIGGTWLRGRSWRSAVRVTVTARSPLAAGADENACLRRLLAGILGELRRAANADAKG